MGAPPGGRTRVVVLRAVFLAVVMLIGAAIDWTQASASTGSGWSDASLHVVGSPVTSAGVVVVLDVTSSHQMELSAVRPKDGKVLWHRPFSPSEITPGVAFGPTAIDGTVLDLSPVGSATDPSVTVEGIAAATGRREWSLREPVVLSDAPAVCGADFCLAAFTSTAKTALALVAPATGALVGILPGVERSMGVTQPGTTPSASLWETDDATPTLAQVSSAGAVLWTKSVASLFAGSEYNPDYGWDFLVEGTVDVGSVGTAPSGNTYPLGSDKTVGISVSNGTVEWTTPGYYVCGGGLSFLRANVLCRYSGAAHRKGSTYTMAGVTAVLEGFDPATGASTWSVPVRGAKALSIGANLAFADATHVVVQLASGKRVLLDVRTGADTPIRSGTSYWCEQIPLYRVNAPTGAVAAGKRQGSAVFSPCTATGSPADRLPATAPSTVGVRVGTSFVWPTRHGLRGIRR